MTPPSSDSKQQDLEARADALRLLTLDELFERASEATRTSFPAVITFSVPGARRYDNDHYSNHRHSFVEISLTGRRCALGCDHCRGTLLVHMLSAPTPAQLARLADRLARSGCSGILLSGGAEQDGRVDFQPFYEVITDIAKSGMRVLAHTGLLDKETARRLREAGVSQVLLDVIGDDETVRQVYHLERSSGDYLDALCNAREAGLSLAPHIVLGLNAGQIRGEYRALAFATEVGVDALVVVVLKPLAGTPFQGCQPPSAEEVGRFISVARLLNPRTPIALGCARPVGPDGTAIETAALRAGVNAIAFPHGETVQQAYSSGLSPRFVEACCSLIERT